jgi:hypothetical protein
VNLSGLVQTTAASVQWHGASGPLEFPDRRTVLLTLPCEGQAATVLQLRGQLMTAAEEDAQKRVTYLG